MLTWKSRSFNVAIAVIATCAVVTLAACGDDSPSRPPSTTPQASRTTAPSAQPAAASTFVLTSAAFTNDGEIPVKYSCSGDSTSPALSWAGAPAGTTEFVLVVHDPDAPLAGGFTHWIVTDIPGSATSLPAAVPVGATISGGGTQLVAYRGMCPPVGAAAHHYHFRLYALGSAPDLNPDPSKDSVEAAIKGHILAQTDLVGLFGR